MDFMKCPRCGEIYSPSYRSCPFCEEDDRPRKVKYKMKSGRRVTEKKKTYSGRNALIVILLLVLALLTWMLFGEKLVARFAKPAEPEFPVENVTPPVNVNDDPFYDPDVGDKTGESVDTSNADLSSKDFTLGVGESVQLQITGSDAPAVWNSKDPTVAVVGSSGFVTAINPGMTTVMATVGDRTLEAIVRVKSSENASGASTVLNKIDFTARVGESVTLKITGTDAVVTWSIDDSSIASISSDGVVTGIRAGKTEAHAMVEGTTHTCVVRIR